MTEGQFSYAQEKRHALLADTWLGFQIESIETSLQTQIPRELWTQSWIGLPPESLQTPYTEIRSLLNLLDIKRDQTLMDLGCAYGRMAHVLAEHFSGTAFIGIESIAPRLSEAERVAKLHRLEKTQWIHADMSAPQFSVPIADILFIYDSSSTSTLEVLLEKIKAQGLRKGLQVVGRGRRIRDLIERGEPWLSQVNPPRHFKNFSIYSA